LNRYDLNYTQFIAYCQEIGYVNIKVVIKMIGYTPFYETLFKKGITEYNLIFKQGFSANTIHRIKKGEAVSTKTLDALCYALDCSVNDIIEFIKE
jgi:DNA-binding Xre family transcriptional regulator